MSFSHFFNDCIKSNGLSVEKWYIEFIDLTNNSIISKDGNYIERNSNNCIKSNLLILDIYNTIGIKACVEATNI